MKKNDYSVKVAAVLMNPVRVSILRCLIEGPCIVNDLVSSLGIEQAVISKQLGLLREAGLLTCLPDGRCRKYELADPELFKKAYTSLNDLAANAYEHARKCSKRKKDNN